MRIQNYTLPSYRGFAATYNCNTYGAGAYNEDGACATVVSGSSDGSSAGGLIDTGVHVILPLVVGAALIIAAVVLFTRRTKKRAPSA